MLDVAHEWVSNESNLLPPCLHATAKKPLSLGVRRGVVLKGREQEFPPTLQSILGRNTFKTLPDPTGSRTFVTSYIFVDWRKLSPRSAFSGPLSLWPDTFSGTQHNLELALQPIPRLERWYGQMVIWEKRAGFSKIPHVANIKSTSVSTPANWKNCKLFFMSLLHKNKGSASDERFLLLSSSLQTLPAILKKEQHMFLLQYWNRQFSDSRDCTCSLDNLILLSS